MEEVEELVDGVLLSHERLCGRLAGHFQSCRVGQMNFWGAWLWYSKALDYGKT